MLNSIGLGAAFLAIIFSGLWTPDLERAELEKRYAASSPQTIDIDGLKVHYKETGPLGAPALLLLHGFGSSLQAWDDWSVKLEQKYRVIRLDLPGFGLTGASPDHDYSEEKDLAILTRFADKLGLDKFSVIGHSMGGKMAWSLAAAQPDRVQALVLMAPDGFPETFCTDHWRCRFKTDDGSVVTHSQILDLLQQIEKLGFDFIKTEHLYTFDGVRGYSLAQGE